MRDWRSYFAEVHRFDTLTTQGRTDRRTWTGLTSSDDELDHQVFCCPRLGHFDFLLSMSRRVVLVSGPCEESLEGKLEATRETDEFSNARSESCKCRIE